MGSSGNTGKIVAAAVGGYVLGRRKKLKLALGLGIYLAAKKLNLNPRTLAKELSDLPGVTEFKNQAGEQFTAAGRDAAGTVVSKLASNLADSLNERTERLQGGAAGAASTATDTVSEAAPGSEDTEESVEAEEPEEAGGERAPEEAQPARSGREKTSAARRGSRTAAKGAGRGAGKGAASRTSTRSQGSRKSHGEGDERG